MKQALELPEIGECYEHRMGRIAQVIGLVERHGKLVVFMRPLLRGRNESFVSLRYLRQSRQWKRAEHIERALNEVHTPPHTGEKE